MNVAVVIPVRNGEAFVSQALASVAGQTRIPNEVVVIDDGSDDASAAEVASWKDRLPIDIVRHPVALGPSAARNAGVAHSTSELIALLDADDVWLPDHLASMINTFEQRGGLITAKALAWVPGQALGTTPTNGWAVPREADQLAQMIVMNFVFVGSVFTRQLFGAAGGFNPKYGGGEDWDLWTRMLLKGARVASPPNPTVLYRIRESSLSADDATLPAEITVLEDMLLAVPPELRKVVERSLRHRRARVALREAYDAARSGHYVRARFHSARALRGPRGVRLRAAATVVSPRTTIRARDAARQDPIRLTS